MGRKLAGLKPRQVVRALEKAGYIVHETTGSHVHLKHPLKPGRVTVPYHERFELPKHIVKSIIRQAELTNEQFLRLLEK
jgi:predicted RNA binding protein YcfA (HicA-like mRNA interferase family)